MQKLDATLDERGVYIILGSRIALLELLLSRETPGAEWRIHQHYVKTTSKEIDKRDSLCGVASKEASPHTRTSRSGFRKAPQRLDDASFSLMKKLSVVDAGQVEFALTSQWLYLWEERFRPLLVNCSRARVSSVAMPSSTRMSVPRSPASRISPTIFLKRSRRSGGSRPRRTHPPSPRPLASAQPRRYACA